MASLPSLNLSYKKETATTLDQTQTTTATNNNNITITVNPSSGEESPTTTPRSTQPVVFPIPERGGIQPLPVVADEEAEKVSLFKDRLIEIQTELLLNNVDLVKNLLESSPNKVIYRKEHLQELIGILTLPASSRANYLQLVDIETQPIQVQKLCCNFTHSIFEDINEITINNKDSFLRTETATKLEKIFKISLRRCIV
jgi:hypothetical protein